MKKMLFHDWTLLRISFDWQSAEVAIELEDSHRDAVGR